MANGSQYFPHDYATTNDPKIQALIGEHGAAGYGIYWRIVEMLHSNEDHILPLKKYIYLAIAKQMLTDAKQIEAILNDCINEYELIVSDGNNFWIERVLRNIETRQNISVKRSEAGKLGAEKRKELAIAKQIEANKRKRKKKIDVKEPEKPINGFPKIPHLSDFYSQQIAIGKAYVEKIPESLDDFNQYRKFITYLHDYNNIENYDPLGESLASPKENLLKLPKQMRFIDFVARLREAQKYGVNIFDKLDAMENSGSLKGKTDFNLTLSTFLKPFSKPKEA